MPPRPDRAHPVALAPGAHGRARAERAGGTATSPGASRPPPRPPSRRSARAPGTGSSTGSGGASSARARKRSVPYSATARSPPPRSSDCVPPVAERQHLVGLAATAARSPAAARPARAAPAARSAGGSARSASSATAGPPPSSASASVHGARRAPRPRRAAGAPSRRSCARPPGASSRSAGSSSCAHARAREAGVGVRRVLAPLEAARAAVLARLLAGDLEQRAHQPPAPRLHAEQRPPAGRDGQPVEHGLGLVGRGVGGGVVAGGQPLGQRGSGRRGPAPAGCRASGSSTRSTAQRHAEPLAQRAAERLVVRRPRRAGRSSRAARDTCAPSRSATSSRQTESRAAGEQHQQRLAPAATSPLSRAASSGRLAHLARRQVARGRAGAARRSPSA